MKIHCMRANDKTLHGFNRFFLFRFLSLLNLYSIVVMLWNGSQPALSCVLLYAIRPPSASSQPCEICLISLIEKLLWHEICGKPKSAGSNSTNNFLWWFLMMSASYVHLPDKMENFPKCDEYKIDDVRQCKYKNWSACILFMQSNYSDTISPISNNLTHFTDGFK